MDFSNIKDENHKVTLQFLPSDYEGVVIKIGNYGDGISILLRINIRKKVDALKWLTDFEQKTNVTYRVERTYEEETAKIHFKKTYRCHHNTKPKKVTVQPHQKHLNCNAKLMITIKNYEMKRSRDTYLKKYPCEILIRHNHNHPLYSSTILKHRPPASELQQIFKELFEIGHSPSMALNAFKDDLLQKHGEKYHEIVSDGQKCPNRKWVYDLYYKMFKKEYAKPSDLEKTAIEKCINEYNNRVGDSCAVFDKTSNLAIAICTPSMKRVHQWIKESGDLMFVDSSRNMDRHNSNIFVFLCPSVVGALPLGFIVTYSDSEIALDSGINLLKTILPENPFYGRNAPKIIITDHCEAENNSFKNRFENSILLLNKFNVLQYVIKYLWNSTQGIDSEDMMQIFILFRTSLESLSKKDFLKTYDQLLSNDHVKSNCELFKFFELLLKRSNEWALCCRNELLTTENEANVDANYRILKDKVMLRKKAYSVVQLFDFLTTNFELGYYKKITDIIDRNWKNPRIKNINYSSKNDDKTKHMTCCEIGYNLYSVTSKNIVYTVNNELEFCSCNANTYVALCKHQNAVIKKFKLKSQPFNPELIDNHFKKLLYKIINGTDTEEQTEYEIISEDAVEQILEIQEVVEEPEIHWQINVEEIEPNRPSTPPAQYENNFEEYNKPIRMFVDNFKACKSDSELIHALCNFGKCSGDDIPNISQEKSLQETTA